MLFYKILTLSLGLCLAFTYVNGRPGADKSPPDYEHQPKDLEHQPKDLEHEHQYDYNQEHQPPHEHDKDCGHPIKEGIEKVKKIVKNAIDDVKKTVKETVKGMLPPPPPRKRPGYEEKDKPKYPIDDKKEPYPYPPEYEKEPSKPSKKPEYDNHEYEVKPQDHQGLYPELPKIPIYKNEEESKKEYEEPKSFHHPTLPENEDHKEYKEGFSHH